MNPFRLFRLTMILSFGAVTLAGAAEHTKDSLSDVKKNIDDEKAILVDVREQKEWDSGHIEDAVFLPLSSLRDGVSKDELKPLPKDQVLYLHCRSGGRCLVAGEILKRHGFTVRPLKPGYEDLISAGFRKAKEKEE